MQTWRILNLFLASPSDVASERALAEEVVSEVNKLIGPKFGWNIALHKWEEAQPGFGRPQEQINPMVDECDLFIGLLWEKWGQPSGKYSSGFEEEFERARARRKDYGQPEIWLVFKEVNQSKLSDPGDQLKRVLAFRKSQESLREVLFRVARDENDWAAKLQRWLLRYVFDLPPALETMRQQAAHTISPAEAAGSSTGELPAEMRGQPAVPEQLRDLSALLSTTLESSLPELFGSRESILREFDVARLYLLSATLMSRRYTTDVLGTHDTNLLYKHREELDATTVELFQLFRTIVGDSADVKPGWFWFKGIGKEEVSRMLLGLTTKDPADDVKAAALRLLGNGGIEITYESLEEAVLQEESWELRRSALDYLATQGGDSAISFLERLDEGANTTLSSAIRDARFGIIQRLNPARALSEVIAQDEYVPAGQLRPLQSRISETDDRLLVEGTLSSWADVRKLCLEELSRRGKLSPELAEKFTGDSSLAVRAVAFQSLAQQGKLPRSGDVRRALRNEDEYPEKGSFGRLANMLTRQKSKPSPDVDSIIVAHYCTQSTEELLSAVDWFSVDGHLAYRALALDRFDSISAELRSDLADGFERVKQESLRRAEKEIGVSGREKLAASFENLDEFIRSQFIKAALFGLVNNAEPRDARLVRSYLGHANSSLRELAAKIISRVGKSEDVPSLLKIAMEDHGDARTVAAAGALKLAENPRDVAQKLTLSKSPAVARVAFGWMFTQNSPEIKQTFEKLLRDEDEANRIRALYYFSSRLRSDEMEHMLNEHIAEDTYYYNVVTWLDRLLYAPPPLRDMFSKDLQQKARG